MSRTPMDVVLNVSLFITGLIVGNWMAIGRDRRKEFNEVADRVFLWADAQRKSPSLYRKVPHADLLLLARMLPTKRRQAMERQVIAYEQASGEKNQLLEHGDAKFREPRIVSEAVEELQKLLHRR